MADTRAGTLAFQRSIGRIAVRVDDAGGRARLSETHQSGAARLRFPRVTAGVEAMVLNTSGGLAEGDRFEVCARVDAHSLTVSTQACERIYRSAGGAASVLRQTYEVGEGAVLRALPQPTILFEGARLDRRTRVDLSPAARMTLVESLVFGRAAMGETVSHAHVSDRLEVWRGVRPAFIDALKLTPQSFARAAEPAGLAGARAVGLVLHQGRDDAVDVMRTAGAGEGVRLGASRVGGLAVARILASSHGALHTVMAHIVQALDGAPAPRTWSL